MSSGMTVLPMFCHSRSQKSAMHEVIVFRSLEDVIHNDNRLFLVFEFLDLDLKRFMDMHPNLHNNHNIIKVSCPRLFHISFNQCLTCFPLSLPWTCSCLFTRCSAALHTAIYTGQPSAKTNPHSLLPMPIMCSAHGPLHAECFTET